MALANGNPGPDTITLAVDITPVTAGDCGMLGVNEPFRFYMATVTDDVVIEGNGHYIQGAGFWVMQDGIANVPGTCPAHIPSVTMIAQAPGLLRLESGSVTVRDLTLRKLSAIAEVRQGGGNLTLERVKAYQVFDFFFGCDRPAISLSSTNNASVRTIRISDSTFSEAWNNGAVLPTAIATAPWLNALITGTDPNAVLEVSNGTFELATGIPVIEWSGTTKVQNSRVIGTTGFMHTNGAATIVNSAFAVALPGQGAQQRFVASHGGSITFDASSISASTLDCQPASCQGVAGPGLLIAESGATITLKASAVGVSIPTSGTNPVIREATGGNVTATGAPNPNWVQPVAGQSAVELRAILNQPALLTDPPGLPSTLNLANFWASVTPLLGTPLNPGLLIDAVPDATTTNVLLSPINGATITTDVFGITPRTEANGTRNIGAVQLALSPQVSVSATGDGSIHLAWTRPLDPLSGAITGYAVLYRATGAMSSQRLDVAGAGQTSAHLAGLSNGVQHEIIVRAVNPLGDGPDSNTALATPLGLIAAPSVVALAHNGEVTVLWNVPDGRGHVLGSYTVLWRPLGTTTWTGAALVATPFTPWAVVTGLTNGVTYQFSVVARAVDGTVGASGLAQAQPIGPPTAIDDAIAVAYPAGVHVPASGVLGNDLGNGSSTLSAVLVTGAAQGTLDLRADGSFTYVPRASFTGTDTFTYRAVSALGAGGLATVSLHVAAPPSPSALRVESVVGRTVLIRWDPPAGANPDAYLLEGGRSPGEVLASVPTGTTAPIFAFVAPAGIWSIRVHALYGAVKSAASNEVPLYVEVPVAPSAPRNLLALVNNATFELRWKNTFEGGAPTGLVLDVTGAATGSFPIAVGERFTYIPVPAGSYTLRLRQVNAAGSSPPSDPITVLYPGLCSGPPETPARFLGYHLGTTGYVIWDPPPQGPAPTDYVLDVGGTWTGSLATPLRALSGTVLSGGTYVVRVQARNACGVSPQTAPQTIVVVP